MENIVGKILSQNVLLKHKFKVATLNMSVVVELDKQEEVVFGPVGHGLLVAFHNCRNLIVKLCSSAPAV